MFFSDLVTLRSVTYVNDTVGFPVETPGTDTQVWANVKSVVRSEFYSANANGIDANISFEIHVEDWSNQTQVIYNTKTYYVIRAYQKGLGVVELTCSDKAV